jgi:hypothetical protein
MARTCQSTNNPGFPRDRWHFRRPLSQTRSSAPGMRWISKCSVKGDHIMRGKTLSRGRLLPRADRDVLTFCI